MSDKDGSLPWNIIKNPVNGRTRISQACDRCRARKIKCSGKSDNNPRCTNCEKDGFQCVVSDKLTRNSFPKGYTKGLELKLLDVELQRNRLIMEVAKLKEALNKGGGFDIVKAIQSEFESESSQSMDLTITSTSSGVSLDKLPPNLPSNGEQIQPTDIPSSVQSTPHETKKRIIETNQHGAIMLDQNLMSPFNTFMKSLKTNSFNGYEMSDKSEKDSVSESPKSLPDHINNTLIKYHMNLNRYLNLILYKLILPLFNFSASANTSGSNKNLDHLIWLFFNDYNKLIPILDFELFYNDYLNFVTTYTLKNSTYQENGESKKKYYEFNLKEQDIMMKLILILKFTLCQPKTNGSIESLLFPDKMASNQLNESIKLINTKHLIIMFKNSNFIMEPYLDKLEISLLTFYYLVKFENYNLQKFTDDEHTNILFLRDIINLSTQLVSNLNIDKADNSILLQKQNQEQLIKIQRLKLYWDYKILIKLAQIYFNLELDPFTHNGGNEPPSIESIKLINSDLQITLALIKLLDKIPTNIMTLVMDNNEKELNLIDIELQKWKDSITKVPTPEDSNAVFKKLQSYHAYFKVLINLCKSIDGTFYAEYVNLVYDLTFNNSKNPNKVTTVSLETAESLCLHSFNFHLISLVSIIKLKNVKNKELKTRIVSLVQLYQIIIKLKDMDPVFKKLVTYIIDFTPFGSQTDMNMIQDETLQLFAEVPDTTTLFKKKSNSSRNSISFDLNAFSLPGDTFYSTDESIGSKRRKSNSSSISSNLSLNSRESSICSPSRRMSASSNDGVPSLFASAISPYPADSISRRPNRMRSSSSDSRLRLSRQNSISEKRGRSGSQGHFVSFTDDEAGGGEETDSVRSSLPKKNNGNSSTLPTILSEGNLMKSMNVLSSMSNIDAMDVDSKLDNNEFTIDNLFNNNSGTPHNNNGNDHFDLADLGNIDLENIDLTKLKKEPMDYSNAFTPSPSTSFNPTSVEKYDKLQSNQLIDDNDMSQLRERVMNLKSTTS